MEIIMYLALVFRQAFCLNHKRNAPDAVSIITAIGTDLHLVHGVWFKICEYIRVGIHVRNNVPIHLEIEAIGT